MSKNVAQRIREIMEKKGFTQKDLSEMLEVSQPAISLYLQGRMPPADVLYKLARLGNTSMEWLLTGVESGAHTGSVREESPIYGNQHLLIKLWKQLPPILQKDVLILLRHLVENLPPDPRSSKELI